MAPITRHRVFSDLKKEVPNGNTPLPFTLKNLDARDPRIKDLGFDEGLVTYFGAGVCARGLMKGRLTIAIHSPTGELLAYAGRSLKLDRAPKELYRYPENFRRELELYNIHRAVDSGDYKELGVLVVPDFLDVWRFYAAGFENAIAVMGAWMSRGQVELLASLLPRNARVSLVLPDEELDRVAGWLAPHFYVRALQADPADPNEVLLQMIDKSH